jgi:hypothetical protein
MTESQWPDPTPEPGEQPRWLRWVAYAAIAVGIVFLVSASETWRGALRLPDFSMPQLEMPEIAVPEVDLRGRSEPAAESPSTIESITEGVATFPNAEGPIVRSLSFESCLALLADTGARMGQEPTLLENTADRRVARFKLLEGDVTVTCSRADGTMTIENRG